MAPDYHEKTRSTVRPDAVVVLRIEGAGGIGCHWLLLWAASCASAEHRDCI